LNHGKLPCEAEGSSAWEECNRTKWAFIRNASREILISTGESTDSTLKLVQPGAFHDSAFWRISGYKRDLKLKFSFYISEGQLATDPQDQCSVNTIVGRSRQTWPFPNLLQCQKQSCLRTTQLLSHRSCPTRKSTCSVLTSFLTTVGKAVSFLTSTERIHPV
jgi:hypothetical protein